MRALVRLAPVLASGWSCLPAGAETVILDLHRVKELVIQRSPLSLRARLDADTERARGLREGRGPMLAPTLGWTAGPCLNGAVTGCVQAELSFPLPLPGENDAAGRLGLARGAAGHLRAAASLWSARTRAALAYVRLLAARARLRLSEESLRVARDLARATAVRARAGDAGRLDDLQAETRALRRARDLEQARLDERGATHALRELLLLRTETLVLREDLEQATQAALRANGAAPTEHPRVAEARGRARLGGAAALLAGRRRWPRIAVVGSYQRDDFVHQFLVGLSIPLTPVSSVPDADLQVARAEERRARREVDYLIEEIRIALQSARARLDSARRLREAARAASARSRELVAALRRGHQLGQLDLFRVLLAEEEVLQAAWEEVGATQRVAEAALLVAAGGTP
jgi:outer membrane protein TolC